MCSIANRALFPNMLPYDRGYTNAWHNVQYTVRDCPLYMSNMHGFTHQLESRSIKLNNTMQYKLQLSAQA